MQFKLALIEDDGFRTEWDLPPSGTSVPFKDSFIISCKNQHQSRYQEWNEARRKRWNTPSEDEEHGCFYDGKLTEAKETSPFKWELRFVDLAGTNPVHDWGINIEDLHRIGTKLQVGDVVRFYGKYFDVPHGISVNGKKLWYNYDSSDKESH